MNKLEWNNPTGIQLERIWTGKHSKSGRYNLFLPKHQEVSFNLLKPSGNYVSHVL
jgi:hypothetical protein